jgi:hypothetical protein
MKKFTLLFATLLAMSGDAFGQKEGKVLWETPVESSNFLRVSSNGSIMTGEGKVYDTNGKFLWNLNDYYKTSTGQVFTDLRNPNYTLMQCDARRETGYLRDSTLFFDKNFKYVKGFDWNAPNTFVVSVDDGVFYSDKDKTLLKYNSEGKEEWRFENDNPINIVTSKAPYIGIIFTPTDKREMIILNKRGKKTGITEPQTFRQIFSSNDGGFWLVNNEFEYIKFDSTGKQTTKYSDYKGTYNYITSASSILSDNSLMLSFLNDNEALLIKVSTSGEIVKYSIPARIKFKDFYTTFIFKGVESQNKIMYSLRLQDTEQAEADIKYKIGVVDFDNTANSWSKDIHGGASNGINGNAFTFEVGNTFFQIYSKPDNPPIKIFKVYDIAGNLKWESPFVSSFSSRETTYKIVGDYLYTQALYESPQGFVKVRMTDGKIIWSKLSPTFSSISIQDYRKNIQIDKNGNDVIMYTQRKPNDVTEPFSIRISVLNADGTEKWFYKLAEFKPNEFSQASFYQRDTQFAPTDDGKLIVLSQETKDNKLQFILRKLSPCSDLNAIAITGNTEACPTEKVRLSAAKQDGITYQWQKDGKDLPNYKDVVYDMSESGVYTLIAKDEACQNTVTSNALKVTIRSLPNTEITAPKTIFCEGDKTAIASKTNGTFFQWQKDGKDIPNATSGIYEATQLGNYRVGVRDDKCPQVGYSNIVTINVKPAPEATISTDIKGVIYEPFKVKMIANIGTGLSYEWLKNDSLITNATTSIYEADKSGIYQVKVAKDGCVKLSEPFKISILIPLANESEVGEEEVQVYPNPSRGEFKIILPKSFKSADIQLFDSFGREHSLLYIGEQAQANGLVQGVYFLKVGKESKVVTSKIVIE